MNSIKERTMKTLSRMLIIVICIGAAILPFSSSTIIYAQSTQGADSGIIAELRITGLVNIPKAFVEEVVSTSFAVGKLYSKDFADDAVTAILETGYFESAAVTTDKGASGLVVFINCVENRRIESITVRNQSGVSLYESVGGDKIMDRFLPYNRVRNDKNLEALQNYINTQLCIDTVRYDIGENENGFSVTFRCVTAEFPIIGVIFDTFAISADVVFPPGSETFPILYVGLLQAGVYGGITNPYSFFPTGFEIGCDYYNFSLPMTSYLSQFHREQLSASAAIEQSFVFNPDFMIVMGLDGIFTWHFRETYFFHLGPTQFSWRPGFFALFTTPALNRNLSAPYALLAADWAFPYNQCSLWLAANYYYQNLLFKGDTFSITAKGKMNVVASGDSEAKYVLSVPVYNPSFYLLPIDIIASPLAILSTLDEIQEKRQNFFLLASDVLSLHVSYRPALPWEEGVYVGLLADFGWLYARGAFLTTDINWFSLTLGFEISFRAFSGPPMRYLYWYATLDLNTLVLTGNFTFVTSF